MIEFMPGEFEFIDWVRGKQFAATGVRVGIGDDLAVLDWAAGDLLLVGVDQVLDGVHFDSAKHSPRAIGRKVMNRNLSDVAAMAALPAAAVCAVALPSGIGEDYAKALYLGLREAADRFECPLVGGDTGTWAGKLAMSVTILGRSAGIEPITRRGAKIGDGIYVTGPLGGSIRGRHLTFEPRIALARELAGAGGITAMIDISDGLSRDLGHLCSPTGLGAVLDAGTIPIHGDVGGLGGDPLSHALHDGEDHELLFTGKPPMLPAGVTRVGTIVDEPGIWLNEHGTRRRLLPLGWEHRL